MLTPYRMMVENYRELLGVKEQLEKFYLQDIGLLRKVFNVQSKTIVQLQDKIETTAMKRKRAGKYNLRESQSATNFIDESTWGEITGNLLQLSNKDPTKMLRINELEEKQKELEKVIREQEIAIMKKTMNASSSAIVAESTIKPGSDPTAVQNTEENDFVQLIQSEFKCSICREILIEAVLTNCSHIYCKHCLAEWEKVGVNPTCPICRNPSILRVNAVAIDSFLNNCASLMPSSPAIQNWQRLKREAEEFNSEAETKRRRLNAESSGRSHTALGGNTRFYGTSNFRTCPFIPTSGYVLNLDGDDDVNVVLANLSNFTSRVNQTSFSVTGVVNTTCSSTTVVDLTEDDAD